MFRLLLLLFLFHHSQGYSVVLNGKLEFGNDLAVVLQNFISKLSTSQNGQAEFDIGKLMNGLNEGLAKERAPEMKAAPVALNSMDDQQVKKGKSQVMERVVTEDSKAVQEVKEKTLLEDLVGKQESVHLYGQHGDHDSHINNIRV